MKQQRGVDLVRVTMNLPRDLWRRQKLQAVNEDATATKIVVKLVERYLKKRSGKDGVRMYRGSWVVDYRDAAGKRHIEAVESRDAGNDKLAQITKALRSKTYDPGRAKTPLQGYAVEWLQSKRAEIAPSTFTSYEYVLRVHILPELGRFELGRLTRPQVRLFLAKKTEEKK